mgnify:CR=1 FL=1
MTGAVRGATRDRAVVVGAGHNGLVAACYLAKAGLDATFLVDGVPGSSSSNVVSTAVPGLELTLKALTAGEITVSVGYLGYLATPSVFDRTGAF